MKPHRKQLSDKDIAGMATLRWESQPAPPRKARKGRERVGLAKPRLRLRGRASLATLGWGNKCDPTQELLTRCARKKFYPAPQAGQVNPQGGRKLDLHGKTEEQAWELINAALDEVAAFAAANGNKIGLRRLTIITGASGILKQKLPQWATESILSPKIVSCRLVNNGCYEVVVRKNI